MNASRAVLLSLLAMLSPAILWAQSPALLVLNKEDATLALFDPATRQMQAKIATGDGPHEVEVSSDGRLAFVSNYGAQTPGNSLSVIDLATRKEIHRVDLGDMRRPHGLAMSGDYLYFTAEAAKLIGRYDPKANKVDWKFETLQEGTHMVAAARDGAKFFTTNMGSNNVSIVERDAAGPWSQTLVAVGAGPEGLDLTPDGRELWVAHSRDGGVSIIDVASRKVTATIDAQTKRSNRLKFTPDGKLALISDLSGGELVVIDTATRKQKTRLSLGRAPTGILITPDGSRAYVALAGDKTVAVVDLKTLAVSDRIATGNGPDGMAWVRQAR
jgi:YVTN family beta-propeller protein